MLSDQDIARYLNGVGNKAGLKIIANINELRPYVEAIQSGPGKYVLELDVKRYDELLNKVHASIIAKGGAEREEVIELQYLHGRLKKIYGILSSYMTSVKTVKLAKEAPL